MCTNHLLTGHFVKIAWRNLKLNKTYSFINIVGLGIGLTVSALILLFVVHEMNFDKFHKNGDRIYKVEMIVKHGDQSFNIDGIRANLANKIKEGNSSVIDFVRFKDNGKVILKNFRNPASSFKEKSFVFADRSLFSVFTFPLKEGDANSALQNPFSVILSEKAASKYYGTENPIGQSLLSDGQHLFTITGVMKDVPTNSSMNFDFVTSIETYARLGAKEKNIWEEEGAFRTYIFLNDQQKAEEVEKSIGSLIKDKDITYSLHQYSTQHLKGGFNNNLNARFVYIFLGIGILILFLALFNYISLTTARATTRAKEVGVRKVIGVGRSGLIKQFYLESLMVCLLAFGLAFILINILLNSFYNLLGIQIDSSFLVHPDTLSLIGGLFVVCVLIAGSYPALVLAKFKPIEVLKGKYSSKQGGSYIRKGITVFQFVVSIALIISVIITKKQLRYLKTKELGFSQSQILAVPTEGAMNKDFLNFKNEINQLVGVQSITSSTSPFYKGYNAWFTKSIYTNKDVFVYSMTTDENFFNTIGLEWASAPINTKNIDKKIFINEIAASQLEIGKDYIGKSVELGQSKMEIGGILKDFHFNALREEIKPLVISVYPESKIDFEQANLNPTLYIRFEPNSNLTKCRD